MRMRPSLPAQRGAMMIEVLVTIVICVIGLWGLTQVQTKLQVSELESYQRSQAMLLLDEISSRLEINRGDLGSYIAGAGTGSPLGKSTCPSSTSSLADRDLKTMCESLQGAAEQTGTSSVGAMIGARACIEDIGDDEYMITVAWQGMAPLSAPPSSVACGKDDFNKADTGCVNDLCRRAITTTIRISDLST